MTAPRGRRSRRGVTIPFRSRAADPAAPPAPAPDARVSQALLFGGAFIALPVLLHALLLPVWGEGTMPLFIVFMLSLLPGVGACFVLAGGGMLRIGYAMVIVVGAAFASLHVHEARIFGLVPTLDAAQAPAHRAAAGFVLPGATARADIAREVRASISLPRRDARGRSAGRMELQGRFTVVPVVGPDWAPGMPVPVVAVIDHGPDVVVRTVAPAPWDAGRGVLRLLPDPLRDHAVQRAFAEAGWTAAPGVVIGRWVENPRWARLGAAGPLLWILAAALLGWSLVILCGHPWIAARLGRVMEAPETQRPDDSMPAGPAIVQGIVALTLPSLVALGVRHAEAHGAVTLITICFAVVPSLMITIRAFGARTPIAVIIIGVILVVFVPLAVVARGAGPGGTLPTLDGARWADVQEATIVLGAGCLVWAALVIAGRLLEGRGHTDASR